MPAPFLAPLPASTAPARLANHSLFLVTPNPFSCFPLPTTTSLTPVYKPPMASRITVERQRSLLEERGFPTKGFKPALVERCRANKVALGGRSDDLPPAPGSSSTTGTPESRPPRNSPTLAPSSAGAGDDGSGLGANREIRPAALGGTPAEAGDQAGWTAPASEVEDASSTFSLGAGSPRPISSSTVAPDAASPDDSGPVGAGCPPPSSSGSSASRAPDFTKHERVRLAHILCQPEVAAGVVTSRGVMSRLQQDARTSRGAVWVVVVASIFNSSDLFDVPTECTDGGINPNSHPHVRIGETLKAKWSEVRLSTFPYLMLILIIVGRTRWQRLSTHLT